MRLRHARQVGAEPHTVLPHHRRLSAPLAHPGHRQMTHLTAGLLACGSSAGFAFPELSRSSGIVETGLAAYSCGGSRGIGWGFESPSPHLIPSCFRCFLGTGTVELSNGRSERIRTSDPLVPNEVRYQAAPHSDTSRSGRYSPPFKPSQGREKPPALLRRGAYLVMFRRVSRAESASSRTWPARSAGASPSGKATDFDSVIRRFESSRPSQTVELEPPVFSLRKNAPQTRALKAAFGIRSMELLELAAEITPIWPAVSARQFPISVFSRGNTRRLVRE